jgi:hypothetical protein
MLDNPAIHRTATQVLCAAVVLLALGCTASISATTARPRVVYSYPVAYVDAPPPRLHERAHVYYRGRPAYLVGSRWYYPANGDWVYFQREPEELRRARLQRQLRDPVMRRDRPRADTRRRYRRAERDVEPPRETRRRRYD